MQYKLDFTDPTTLTPYQKFIFDVKRLLNSNGLSAYNIDREIVEIASKDAVYFSLPAAISYFSLLGSAAPRRFAWRITATLKAMDPEWKNLDYSQQKVILDVILSKYSREFCTGPNSILPQLQILEDWLKTECTVKQAIAGIRRDQRKKIENVIRGLSGGKIPNSRELGRLVAREARNEMNDPNFEFFATYGTWKMIHNYTKN